MNVVSSRRKRQNRYAPGTEGGKLAWQLSYCGKVPPARLERAIFFLRATALAAHRMALRHMTKGCNRFAVHVGIHHSSQLHLKSLMSTRSLVCIPRATAICLPSRDRA
jgi:hypothetical protein